ncbi:amino acid adenylation domain-containing protein [Chitinophaga sp. W2I13]|uniref:non-ribosomal peptide synthetase n=1 Tax=Chitinophaga sp. W2I13 TaxID=3373923 RepID=UPI003D1FF4CA
MEIVSFLRTLKESGIDISLQGSDLEISYDGEQLPPDIVASIRQKKSGIIDFLKQFSGVEKIPLAPLQKDYPLTFSQKGLWLLCQESEGNAAYNMTNLLRLEGKLQINELEYAFRQLIVRHESLRTLFSGSDPDDVRQCIVPAENISFGIVHEHWSGDEDALQKAMTAIQAQTAKPFDLSAAPLLRVCLYQTGQKEWLLLCVMHHIIGDRWSMEILTKELLHLYQAAVEGRAVTLEPLRIQYKDYAVWMERKLGEGLLEKCSRYWQQQFSGELPVLQLWGGKTRPPVKTYNGAFFNRTMAPALARDLRVLLQQHNCTLFMGLLAAVKALFYKYTGQEDIVIGTSVAGREDTGLENQIGLYLNTLALRTRFRGEDSFSSLLENIRETTLEAHEHSAYPFSELLMDINPPRDISRSPLFDVTVSTYSTDLNPHQQAPVSDVQITIPETDLQPASKFDLSFDFFSTNEEIQLCIEYNTDVFTTEMITQLYTHLEQLLMAAVADPGVPLRQMEYIPEQEKHKLIHDFNTFQEGATDNVTFVELFEQRVAAYPDKAAVVFENQRLSYRELNEEANRLAGYLRKNYLVGADDIVGISLERSEQMVVAVMGVLKAGAAYMPLDPAFPPERVRYMLEDSQSKVVIDKAMLDLFRIHGTDYPAQNPDIIHHGGHLAYIIYTSGSTGKPKGAMVEHAGMLNHMIGMVEALEMDAGSNLAQNAVFTFDISVWQLLTALITGGTTTIYSNEVVLDPQQFSERLTNDGITVLEIVPSYLKVMLDSIEETSAHCFESLRCLIVTAESASHQIIKRWFRMYPDTRVLNAYGPAEAADDVTLYIMNETPPEGIIPIGRPIRNLRIYILDQAGKICPPGVTGEIYVAGIAVGRGYVSDPEKTAKAFTTDPFCGNGLVRMYKTGDLGRWLHSGELEFLGRRDNQVKVHGYRIELGEIENCLQACPGVDAAAVLVWENSVGDKRLVAYVTGKELLDDATMDAFLATRLPAYMMPHCFIRLAGMPMYNNKINRKKLPTPEEHGSTGNRDYVAPGNDIEKKLVSIWEEVLRKEPIGIRDNFFRIGGHSLLCIKVISRIHAAFNVKIKIKYFFRYPVIESLAMYIVAVQQQENITTESEEAIII